MNIIVFKKHFFQPQTQAKKTSKPRNKPLLFKLVISVRLTGPGMADI